MELRTLEVVVINRLKMRQRQRIKRVPDRCAVEIRRFEGHIAPVTDAVFSADGSAILSGSTDATVRLWDVATGQEIRRLRGQATAVWCVSYSPDGKHAVSGSIFSSLSD